MKVLGSVVALTVLLLSRHAVGEAAAASLSGDPEIAKVVMTLNKAEIRAASLELSHGSNKDAKNFAQMMLKAHQESYHKMKGLSEKDSLSPKSSDLNRSVESDVDHLNTHLSKTHNTSFDKTYVDDQITMHEDALKLLDEKLIPNAKNADLKRFLENTRQAVNQHLNHARDLEYKIYRPSL